MFKRQYLWIVFVVTGLLAACSTTQTGGPGSLAPNGPAWVNKGNGAFTNIKDKAFYGVGSVSGVQNKSLSIQAADNRARAEIAKIFQTYSASLMRDYARSTTAGDMKKSSEEQDISNAVKTFSAATLSGVVIVDHWQDSQDGTLYSLVKLDIEKFKESIDKAKELNAATRDYVRANADRAFEQLDAEETKRVK